MASIRIEEFDTWRPGYGAATVRVLQANTTLLAPIYSDEDLTVPVSNPVTLIERVVSEVSYGRFQSPIYVGVPYQLAINSVDVTGIQRPPLTTLAGQDASLTAVTVAGGSESIELEDILGRGIDVRDHGEFKPIGDVTSSRATNTTTLTTAIGEAAGRGAAYVNLPAGTFQTANYSLPAGVILRGEGRDSTILQSNQAGSVATITGDGAGFTRLTLDGVTLVPLSVGVRAVDRDRIVFDDVLIKRFETGLDRDGGAYTNWRDLSISDCATGYKAYATTAELKANKWSGGGISLCSAFGLDLRYDGEACDANRFVDLFFDTNTGTAVNIKGATATALRDCTWSGNTTNLAVSDFDTAHQVTGIEITDGSMNTGALTFTGLLAGIAFRRMVFTDPTVTITAPVHTILIEDCVEDGVSISGTTTAWLRHQSAQIGATFGETPGATVTKAWSLALDPGDCVYLVAKVIGRQINSVNRGFYYFACSAFRLGAALVYDSQTGNFTPGRTVTGATSGATAVIQADTDNSSNGTLVLVDVVGSFVDNEIITDGAGGSATASGTLSFSSVAISVGSGVTDIIAPSETAVGWAATFAANGPEIELRVTGASGATVEWTAQVEVMRN